MSVLLSLQGANIGRRASLPVTRAAIGHVRHGAPQDVPALPAVCWQEVNDDNAPVDERDLITERFPEDDFTTFPKFDRRRGALVPVTMPAPWRVQDRSDQWAHKIGDGKPHVEPDRFITVRVMRHPLLAAPLAVVSWQQIQGAFTDPGQPHEAYRRAQWHHQWYEGVRPEVIDLVRQGITVGYAADTNRPHCPLIRWDDRRVIQDGLDALGFIEGRGKSALQVQVRRTWSIPLLIDGHRGTGALLALS